MDAKQLEEDVGASPRSFGGPSNDVEPVNAVYRESMGQEWRDVEIIDALPDRQFVLRETGRVWPGVILAAIDQVRIPGPILEFHEPFGNERKAA
jgi:hypothetical protein